jgi:hypothetical protein
VDDVTARLVFLTVTLIVLGFVLAMRARLRRQYPDDDSKQMQSMQGFLRGCGIFLTVVAALAGADLIRVLASG